jgi:Condensation domain
MSTLVNAVYSLTLAQLTGQRDLIFFRISNGRSLPIPEIENTRGCCTNLVPIRAAIQPAWTGLDLLCHLRRQKTRTLPHDFVFWNDIAENCIKWPRNTPVGAMLLYQNIELEPRFSICGFEYRMREVDIWNVEQIGVCVSSMLHCFSRQDTKPGRRLTLALSCKSKKFGLSFGTYRYDLKCHYHYFSC